MFYLIIVMLYKTYYLTYIYPFIILHTKSYAQNFMHRFSCIKFCEQNFMHKILWTKFHTPHGLEASSFKTRLLSKHFYSLILICFLEGRSDPAQWHQPKAMTPSWDGARAGSPAENPHPLGRGGGQVAYITILKYRTYVSTYMKFHVSKIIETELYALFDY